MGVALGILIGGLVAACFWLLGYAAGSRERALKVQPVKPICACTHTRGSHLKGKKCRVAVLHRVNGVQRESMCACTMYDGPIPATELFMPQVATHTDV